jgi:uroporphyrinogen decarboxylase
VTQSALSSLQRVLTTLAHHEPDRVPFFLLLTLHGAKELGLTIKEYFSQARYVVEGQVRLRAKYRHDCYYPFFYAPVEVEAWGGEVIFREDGPPNSGEPFLQQPEAITLLEPPHIPEAASLVRVLQTIEALKAKVGEAAPLIGVVMSPFSLPVMQLGFDRYLDLMVDRPDLFARLMQVNEAFCVEWANAQLAAGATAICYFDPVSSSTIVPRETYLKTGFEVACRTLARIHGPTATHFASGRSLPILADAVQTGTQVVGASSEEDLSEVKAACRGKVTVLGNLNGLEMRRWSIDEARSTTKAALAKAGRGGGFILSDNHGEIPWQVPDETLLAIAETVESWGRYPLDWTEVQAG